MSRIQRILQRDRYMRELQISSLSKSSTRSSRFRVQSAECFPRDYCRIQTGRMCIYFLNKYVIYVPSFFGFSRFAYLCDQCMDSRPNSPGPSRGSRFVADERNCRVASIPRYLFAPWSEISLSSVSLLANPPLEKEDHINITSSWWCNEIERFITRGSESLTHAGVDPRIRGSYIDYLQSSLSADLVLSWFPYFLVVFCPHDLRSDV